MGFRVVLVSGEADPRRRHLELYAAATGGAPARRTRLTPGLRP